MTHLSYRMLYIGQSPAGLLGLDELFNEVYDSGTTPDDADIGEKLIQGVRRHNYVPKPSVDEYMQVLQREYFKFYQDKSGGKPVTPTDYGQWEGIPREQIPWFPTVSAELCDGCGNCLEVCPKDVFARDGNGKMLVVEPLRCIVGCCFCKSACEPHAILMPDREMLDQYRHGKRL